MRGHQVRGIRDWLPLLMPLLVGGMEHAMQLAEAMTARGFAAAPAIPLPASPARSLSTMMRLGMLAGLLLLAAGWLWRLSGGDGFGLALICAGALLILGGLWWQGRQSPRSSYRKEEWHLQDSLVVACALVLLFVLLRSPLDYSPYPVLSLPPFEPLLGLALPSLHF